MLNRAMPYHRLPSGGGDKISFKNIELNEKEHGAKLLAKRHESAENER